VANSIVAIVFLQAAHALMSGRMTRTDILAGWLEEERPFAAGIMRIAFHVAGFFVFALIAQGTWPKLVDAWVENEFFGAQGVFTAPVWPIKACLFGGSLLTCLAFAVQALKDIKDVVNSGRVAPLRVRHSVVTKPKGWIFILAFLGVLVIGYGFFFADLGRVGIGLAAIGFMLLLIFSGAHIAVVLILLSFLGIWLIRDNPRVAMRSLALAADGAINRYLFGVVPLFVLMGLIVDAARVAEDLLHIASRLLGRVRGGLGYAVVIVGALLAASTGIVGATVITMTLIALPTMLRQGYDPKLATGTIAASGTLGQIIPPSIVLILLADAVSNAASQASLRTGAGSAVVSVGDLFAGALIPGLL